MERYRYRPKRAVHPGEILNEELKARGLKRIDVAKDMNIPQKNFVEYLNGKRDFTEEFCSKLTVILPNIPADSWIRLQKQYETVKQHLHQSLSNK